MVVMMVVVVVQIFVRNSYNTQFQFFGDKFPNLTFFRILGRGGFSKLFNLGPYLMANVMPAIFYF